MTNQSEQQVDFFNQFETHFCIVSDQAAANLLPIVYFKPAHLVLLVSKEMRERGVATDFENAVRFASPSTRVEVEDWPETEDLEAMRSFVFELLVKHEGNKPIVNVTGGTKLMSFSALTAAWGAEVPAYYFSENNTVSIIRSGSGGNTQKVASLHVRLSLKNYLAAYGYEASQTLTPALSAGERETAESIISQASMKEVVPIMNALAVAAEKQNQLMSDPSPFNLSGAKKQAFDTLCDYYEKAGHIRFMGAKLCFPTQEDRFYVAGGWLERYVYGVLDSIGVKPLANLIVQRKVKNEIDTAFMHDGTFYIVECKTSNLSAAKDANDVIYKLETLRKVGGKKTGLVLVSFRDIHPEALKRANTVGIKVIQGAQLKTLTNQFRQYIRGAV